MDSYFEKGVRLNGTLWVKGGVHFDGSFEGEIYSSNDFVVGKSGKILGNIKTFNITNKGNIQGNLFAENKVALIDGSRLKGDMSTYRLIVDEGSNFEGRCKMIEMPPKAIKDEIQNLERPLPSKTKRSPNVFQASPIWRFCNSLIANMGIVTIILVVIGVFWYFSKEKQEDFGLLSNKNYQKADIAGKLLVN